MGKGAFIVNKIEQGALMSKVKLGINVDKIIQGALMSNGKKGIYVNIFDFMLCQH